MERLGGADDGEQGLCVLSMQGVARHALGLAKGVPLVRIRAQDPPPPLWKRRELWPWAGIGLVVIAIASFETWARIRTANNNAELTRLEVEYEQQLSLKRQVDSMAGEARRLEGVLESKQLELSSKEQMQGVLDNVIRRRQDLVPGILEAVAAAIGEEIVLDVVEENDKRTTIRLEGWALNDTEGQSFVSRLNEKLEPWQYWVRENKIMRGRNWLGLEGYVFNIWLAPNESGPGAESASAAPAGGKAAKTPPKKKKR